MMPLAQRLAARIRAEGPLRFDAFQEAALYDPQGGYYERTGRVGRTGDFVTGPSWHPAFGRTMARIARRLRAEGEREEKIASKGEEGRREREEEKISAKGDEGAADGRRAAREGGSFAGVLDMVDVGAGEGELLAAADSALRAWGIREHFRLVGVERSAGRRGKAAERVPSAAWLPSLEEIPESSLRGLVVCYELFDALPVRTLFFEGEKLLERVVTLGPKGEGFAWGLAECADGAELLGRFRARGIHLLSSQKLEIRSGATRLAQALAERLLSGLILVFDYGAPARSLYSAARANGTLEAFVSHGVTRDVLTEPGSRDLTAWVDFSELADAFTAAGLSVAGPVSQSRVLSAAGIFDELVTDPSAPPDANREADRRAAAALVQPGGMGESIRVLLASRGAALGSILASWPQHK
ncbi:MAG TPA: SAM-dependent methyltransferase [Thermoanaerobaculia bacterium]|nr:SAM-dependent methyltransferase [Thermoanaerobaculia bacterium]